MRLDFQETIARKLTPQAHAILKLNPNVDYTALVVNGAGTEPAREMLQRLEARDVFVDPPGDDEHAQSALAGLWLWHDQLAESHVISQKISSATGSFWHGIMHRREGEFSNSKHWYSRCHEHPVLQLLAKQVNATFDPSPTVSDLTARGAWRPDRFVDLVERIHRDPSSPMLATVIELQQLEWRELFLYCSENHASA